LPNVIDTRTRQPSTLTTRPFTDGLSIHTDCHKQPSIMTRRFVPFHAPVPLLSRRLGARSAVACAAALLVSGCVTAPPASPTASSNAPTAPGALAARAATSAAAAASSAAQAASAVVSASKPGEPKPFAAVVKDAQRIDGLIPVWHKDGTYWFELREADFDKPLFFGPKIAQGIGENRLFGGSMLGRWGTFGRQQLVQFHRVHNQVQLLALNTSYAATPGTPEGRAVEAAYSTSLLGSAAVASQAHPQRKTVLVEANAILLRDLLGLGIQLQRAYRQNYGFDRANSAITTVRGSAGEVVLVVQAHYAAATLAEAPPGSPVPPAMRPTQPRSLPDARSLFFGLHYAFASLPAQPMKPRRADPRVGYFTSNVADFSQDLERTPQQRFVNRWRLEKKDPTAALSEPVKPITFWLDRTIPLKYRDAIAKGVLGWNVAFERIGFKNALAVQVQPDDASDDTLDVAKASIRWMVNANPSFGAIGPSQVDPRTGEILDADIGFESLSSRNLRALRTQVLGATTSAQWSVLMQLPDADGVSADFAQRPAVLAGQCEHADFAAEQLAYALDVLEARGDLDPDSAEAEQFVLDYLTDTTLHEVGHTLGLRHNFRSSRIYTGAQMADPDFVRQHGLAGSVMEYAPLNLAEPGRPAVPAFQVGLGPYDFWAIEYAYKPMPPGSTPQQEEAELQRVAGRSHEPQLAYGTDEDNGLGIDPESLLFDLGDDPIAFAGKRIDIARDLIRRQSVRELTPAKDYNVLRRSVGYAIREMGRAGGLLARQIGGVRTLRDFPGSGRDPLQPVDAAQQRAALDLIARHFLAADSVVLPAALQRRLAPDFLERTDAVFAGESAAATDYSLSETLLGMQKALLAQLMGDGVAGRILDSEGKFDDPGKAFHLSELYDRLTRDVWSELDARTGDISASRRALQREHTSRLVASLVRPAAQGRADARSLLRQQAQTLVQRLDGAQRRQGLSAEARAHLADGADQLRQALQARMMRPA
jgi:hypothetical protein